MFTKLSSSPLNFFKEKRYTLKKATCNLKKQVTLNYMRREYLTIKDGAVAVAARWKVGPVFP